MSEDATREHNVKARKDAITEGLERIYQIRLQVAAIIEKDVKPLRQDVSAIKQKLRDDYQIGGKALNARLMAYELERFAQDGHDDATLDLIRELWDALPVGGSLDLVDLAQQVTRGNGPAGAPKSVKGARAAGKAAAEANRPVEVCPYTKANGALAKAWRQGHEEGRTY